jgi:dihydropyrimidinase
MAMPPRTDVRSSHAASRFDDPEGKRRHGPDAPSTIGVQRAGQRPDAAAASFLRGGWQRPDRSHAFVAWAATNAAKIYGLCSGKGIITIGSDADVVIWDRDRDGVTSNALAHHRCDDTPCEGTRVRDWRAAVFSRGPVVVDLRPRPVGDNGSPFVA